MVFTLGLRHTLGFCSSRDHLVQFLVIRHLSVPLGTGVVKTFRWRTSQIETVSQTDGLAGVNSLLDRCVAQILYSDCLRISGVDVD